MTSKLSNGQIRAITKVFCVVFSILALGWVFRHVHPSSLWQVLSQAKTHWIGAALAIFGAGFVLAAARWHIVLLLSQCAVTPGATLRAVLIGHSFNTILFGPAGGDLAKSALYSRWHQLPASSVLASCVVDRFLGGAGFLVFAACTPGFSFFSQHWRERMSGLAQSPRALMMAGAVALLVLIAAVIGRRWRWDAPLRRMGKALLHNSAQLASNPKLALAGLLCAVLCHLCVSGVFLFSLKAVTQTPFSLASVFWVFPVISLITAAPVTFSGAGLREGAALYFLGMYRIPAEDAVGASLLVLFTYLVWALLGGLFLLRGRPHSPPKPA